MLKWIVFIFALTATSCGSITTTSPSIFKLRMLATYTQPLGAAGTEAPQSQTFLFKSLSLTQSDGTEVALYASDPITYKVIDRPQLIYSNQDMSAYDGLTFSRATVEFDPSLVITTKKGSNLNLAMDTGTLELEEAFVISKSQSQTLTIKTSWGKTVSRADDGTESATAPTFSMVYTND